MIDPTCAFFVIDSAGVHWSRGGIRQRGSVTELASCGAQRWIWLVDSRTVQLVEAEMPAASRREQALALPYALEDQLLSPLEELSFASLRMTKTRYVCAAFETAGVERTLESLAQVGIEVTHAVPDVFCVPWQESTWTLLICGEDAWLRTGPHAGHRFATANWRPFVEQSLLTNEGERHLRVFGASEEMLASIASVSDMLVVESVSGPPRDSLEHLAEGYAQGATLDLLPALSRRRLVRDTQQRRWWWASAAVVLLAALGHGGFMFVHTANLERELASARAGTLSTFHEMFPDIKRVQDVRVQAAQALAEASEARNTQAPFLELLGAAGGPLVNVANNRLLLESASYGNGALELRVRADDMTVLEGYQQALVGQQLPVSLLSVESRDDKAVGLLRIGQTP